VTRDTHKVYVFFLLAVLVSQAVAASYQYDGEKELDEARKAFTETHYEYGEPKVFVQFSGDAYLPEGIFPDEVEYHKYPTNKHPDAKTDFYTKPGFFRKHEFILRQVHIYDSNEDDIRYIIYTDVKNNIEWFVKFFPFRIRMDTKEENIEKRTRERLVFKGNGELYRRHVDTFFLNHDLERATFELIRYDGHNEVKSRRTGDMNYYQIMGIDDH
jgi:hypothetical protein